MTVPIKGASYQQIKSVMHNCDHNVTRLIGFVSTVVNAVTSLS